MLPVRSEHGQIGTGGKFDSQLTFVPVLRVILCQTPPDLCGHVVHDGVMRRLVEHVSTENHRADDLLAQIVRLALVHAPRGEPQERLASLAVSKMPAREFTPVLAKHSKSFSLLNAER